MKLPDELDTRLLLNTLLALKKGNFSTRMPSDWTGMPGKIADALNDIIETNQNMAAAILDVSRVVGREWTFDATRLGSEDDRRAGRRSSIPSMH